MQSALHALGWGLQRLGIALAVIVFVPAILYVLLVIIVVTGQAAAAFGQ